MLYMFFTVCRPIFRNFSESWIIRKHSWSLEKNPLQNPYKIWLRSMNRIFSFVNKTISFKFWVTGSHRDRDPESFPHPFVGIV